MKTILFICSAVLVFCSCSSNGKEAQQSLFISPDKIRISEIVHDSLTTQQIDAIKIIQSTFLEVYPISLEETITNFKRDQHPDNEIAIWQHMANAYTQYLASKKPALNLETKKEVFKLLLSRSMMPEEQAIANSNLAILTPLVHYNRHLQETNSDN